LKLGIDVCQATVAKYMGRRGQAPSQTWRTFLTNHLGQIVAADFFVLPTISYRVVFVLVFLAHDRRRIRHVAVTAHPAAAWTAQQLREACPWDEAPRFLIHDHAFDSVGPTATAMGIENVVTAPHAPWQNAFVEPFVGSARRECFDHVIVFGEAGVRKLMDCIVRTTKTRARTWPSTRTRRFPVPSCRPAMAPSSRFRRSAACTIRTARSLNPHRADGRAPFCGHAS
jgi:hypothetical protein